MNRGPENQGTQLRKKPRVARQTLQQLDTSLKMPFQALIFPFLEHRDLLSFSLASRQNQDWAKADIETKGATRLLEAVVLGDQQEANRILSFNPRLLLSTLGAAQAYSGKIYSNITALQAALCAGDVEMCEMLKAHFERLDNGQAIYDEQCRAIFPFGVSAHDQTQEDSVYDFTQVIHAILSASDVEVNLALDKQFDNTLSLHRALEDFRVNFSRISFDEQVFNPQHYLKAVKHCIEALERNDSRNKRDLIWCQVLGFTQRFFPACWAQAQTQGINNIITNKQVLSRSFNYCHGEGAYFPLEERGEKGFDCAISLGGRKTRTGPGAILHLRKIISVVGIFVANKKYKLNKVVSQRSNQPALTI